MKRTGLILTAAAFALGATVAQAAEQVTLQLKWVTQAQFAGYYVALENGYYTEEDLNVTGFVRAKLYVSSDAKDTDFTVKLVDVHPDGT
ncbi:MAG: CocE/NonD family hydrolase C-terminal non-catalytic domain-containing protein, partial [Pseudomonadota bacterium]